MKRATLVICLLAAVISVFVVGRTPAHAGVPDTTASSYHIYCDGFTMAGATGSPNIQLWVYNGSTGLIDDYDIGYPTVFFSTPNYTYNITVHFPAQPQGSLLNVEVWGAATQNIGDFDNAGFVDIRQNRE